ncbi:extracellular serine/threonine protein kinase four-jointed [Hyposmocoma kahamanoa]|uniref:extracellular serine/threonine protein kinase four-jointed n=1 Tax=Hyposmocoma kahamanoa TaxID=1477025 RepID=UPI000E6D99F2|nr:extracellular serine/threonine protein kinase four-jointed [Hyposmocoma kahamanoa]
METKVPTNHCTGFDKTNMDRIPSLEDLENKRKKEKIKDIQRKDSYLYKSFVYKDDLQRSLKKEYGIYNYCLISVCISFILGLIIGVIVNESGLSRTLNSLKFDIKGNEITKENKRYVSVSFTGEKDHKFKKDIYPKSLTEDMKNILKDNKEDFKHSLNFNKTFLVNEKTVLYGNVFWGPEVEDAMPQGYGPSTTAIWESYTNQSEVVKMESGCGRMQNRLVTFKDGIQACVRYRQNTDQIQGEIFSFYVAKLMNITNLAPSVVKVVDLKDKLWQNVANEVSTAQWYSNRAVVLTQYIPSLESATIPDIFKPSNRHLNKYDILKMSLKESESTDILIDKLKDKKMKKKKERNFDHIDLKLNKKTIDKFVELAQWSDLIIFDYLTANLDRIVNNLFNFQWNINIMDGPAHNLARKMDSGLLLFLDNESGLLHGYRLLKKYNVYHSLMLDNLCVFRKTTISALKELFETQTVGAKLSLMFHEKNNAVIRDILPPLPEKNIKILHERIGKVLSQVEKCEQNFSVKG